jgi:hypothetical protein
MDVYHAHLRRVVFEVLQEYAAQIEANMKTNAAWTDRTANARQSLESRAYIVGNQVILVACQNMDYGVYLELSNGGKYAIILKTIQPEYQKIMAGIRLAV